MGEPAADDLRVAAPPCASLEYRRALADATEHHASSKTYSGKFLRPHAPHVLALIERYGIRSVLDYGCGKGLQYEWVSDGSPGASIPAGYTLERFWGVSVTKYDPAYPPFAAEPVGPFDLVLCTHVLGSIPVRDLRWVVDRLYSLARVAVYVAEKLGPVRKRVFRDDSTLPRGYTRDDWERVLRRPECQRLEVILSTHEKTAEGRIMTHGRVR